jgi:glycosyltransferase involved in cell wall biosynthesis
MDKKIKLLQLEPVSDLGGVTRYIDRLVQYLPQAQFEVHFAAAGNGPAFELLQGHGATCHRIDTHYTFFTIKKRAQALRMLLQAEQYDIVHAHTVRAGLLAVLASQRTKTNVVFTGHGWRFLQLKNHFKRAILFLVEQYIVRHASAVTYLTHSECQQGQRIAPRQHHSVIPISFSLETFQNHATALFRSTYAIAPDAFVIIMVGRITYQKNPELFIDIAEKIIPHISKVQFFWIGDGDKYKAIATLVASKGLSKHITLTKEIPHDMVIAALRESSLLLFTSRFEGLPITLLEAMAARLPVVAAAVSGIPELIKDQENGFLFKKNDAAEAVKKVVNLYTDTQLRDRMASKAYEQVAKEYAPAQKMAHSFAELYKTVYATNH